MCATLDAPLTYLTLDPGGLRDVLTAFPEQCAGAWERVRSAVASAHVDAPPRRVVIVGVGGSAIGGDLVATLAASCSPVPVQVWRETSPPALDGDTLLIACSHSGESLETIGAYLVAQRTACRRVVVGTGGRLMRLAAASGDPCFRYDHAGPPRSALGHSVFTLLGILGAQGVLPALEDDVRATLPELAATTARAHPAAPEAENPAKRLARELSGRVPVFIGDGRTSVVARRWQNQVNENSKQWAFSGALPEIGHNLVEGFGQPVGAPLIAVLLAAAPRLSLQYAQRVAIVAELEAAAIPHALVELDTDDERQLLLALLLRGCLLGDWVSYYLALLNGVDPLPVSAIARAKGAVAHAV